MRKFNVLILLAAITSMLSGCEVIGDIFKAGAYVGIFAVIIVLAIIFWLFSKFRGRG